MFIARKPFPLPASFGGADTPWYTGGEAVPPSERSSAWWSLGAMNMSLLRSDSRLLSFTLLSLVTTKSCAHQRNDCRSVRERV